MRRFTIVQYSKDVKTKHNKYYDGNLLEYSYDFYHENDLMLKNYVNLENINGENFKPVSICYLSISRTSLTK